MSIRYEITNKNYVGKNGKSEVKTSADGKFVNTKLNSHGVADENKDRENLFAGTVRKRGGLKINKNDEFIEEGQGPGRLANAKELIRDNNGFTHPNLHRRIDAMDRELPETDPREYKLSINYLNSYRTTHIKTHNEETDKPLRYVDRNGKIVDVSEIP